MEYDSRKDLDFLYSEQKDITALAQTYNLLEWDQETYMPQKGINARSEQTSFIGKMHHDKLVSKELEDAVNRLSSKEIYENLGEKDRTVISRLKRDIEKEKKLPSEFVKRYLKETTVAFSAWEKAKETGNFKIFEPNLDRIISLKKEEISYRGFPGHPYNGLMDAFEEGMTVEKLDRNFVKLRKDIVSLVNDIMSSKKHEKREFSGKYNVESQKKLAESIMRKMGMDTSRSRMDISSHPFTTTISPDDVRITTRYNENNPLESFTGTTHESGHALYELGLPREYENTVVQDGASYGLHESQSRIWENVIGRSRPFWKYYLDSFKKEFPQLKKASLDDWMMNVNWVEPSFIRIEADEVTYGLHIILRYELEKEIAGGSIRASEIPEIWNGKMKDYLGIVPGNDREGALQDVHWSKGYFGYFPSYLIGTIYAAQIYNRILSENPNAEREIESGDFSGIRNWLGKNIHSYGRSMSADEIVEKSCGKGLDSGEFVRYLREKYSEIYDL